MPRCIRTGCPNVQETPDSLGLGLCATHNAQFRAGTVGAGHDPLKKQYPARRAAELLAMVSSPDETLREVAERTGVSKDTIRHLRAGTWAHVRSYVWDRLQEAVADYTYRQQMERGDDGGLTPG